MIHLLFFLSIYEDHYDVSTEYGFKKYPMLSFGFKKQATFNYDITLPTSAMVFGLATKEEIKNIEKLSPNSKYCSGNYTLAVIQSKILSGKSANMSGVILSKGIYTPFTYGCHHDYEFDIKFNFLNGNYHRNYLYDIGPIFTMVLGILVFIIFLIFLIFSIFFIKTKNEYVTFLSILFILSFAQCIVSFFLFYEVSSYNEYLYYCTLLKYFFLAYEIIVFGTLFLYLILSVKLKNMNFIFSGEQLLIAAGCAFFSMILDLICFFIEIKDKYFLGFPSFGLLVVYDYFIIRLTLHSIAKYSRVAILLYTIGYTVVNFLNNTIFFILNETFSVPLWILTVDFLYIFIFFASMFIFLLAYTIGHEFENKGSVMKSIYVNTYTNSIMNSEAPMLNH